jgi:hypothetical protein
MVWIFIILSSSCIAIADMVQFFYHKSVFFGRSKFFNPETLNEAPAFMGFRFHAIPVYKWLTAIWLIVALFFVQSKSPGFYKEVSPARILLTIFIYIVWYNITLKALTKNRKDEI